MNFLIKIEEAINNLIIHLFEKLKAMAPHFIFVWISFFTHLPATILKKIKSFLPKLKSFFSTLLGFLSSAIAPIRGLITGSLTYLRSDEFKSIDKTAFLLSPFSFTKHHPFKALLVLLILFMLSGATSLMFKSAEKIVTGTKALRSPASAQMSEEDVYLEFKKHKFGVRIIPRGGNSTGWGNQEYPVFFDIQIEAHNPRHKEFLEHMEEMLDDNLKALEITVDQLPIEKEDQKLIEQKMVMTLNHDFMQIGHPNPIKNIKIKQILPVRPPYYRLEERMMSVADINLQIFLEDTHRNRQVWLEFSILTSNRNALLYLKSHEIEFKDHLTTNVEPVIPQLPIEEEGRLIIKDKIRIELNNFLKKNEIEGKILEVYINYLMVS
jgi:hypothetical protein